MGKGSSLTFLVFFGLFMLKPSSFFTFLNIGCYVFLCFSHLDGLLLLKLWVIGLVKDSKWYLPFPPPVYQEYWIVVFVAEDLNSRTKQMFAMFQFNLCREENKLHGNSSTSCTWTSQSTDHLVVYFGTGPSAEMADVVKLPRFFTYNLDVHMNLTNVY